MSSTPTVTDSSVLIRPAAEDEFQRVAELTVAAYIDGGHLAADDFYVQHLKQVADRAKHARVLVAEVDSQVAGAVTVTESDGAYAEVSRPGELEFRMLAVAPEFQGRGVARTLVQHILAEAESRPEIHGVALCSVTSMKLAHALYRSEGFIADPTRDFILDVPEKTDRFPFFCRKV